ncbi:MAG: DUF1579 family protein [bacterium]
MSRFAGMVVGLIVGAAATTSPAADAPAPPAPAPGTPAPGTPAPGTPAAPALPAVPPAAKELDPSEPGPVHERLKFYVGDWHFTMTHMLNADEPQTSEGTAHCEPILGGRYLQTVTKATMGTLPFEALSLAGYDNVTGEHINVWIDNTGTGAFVSRGRLDEDETLLFTGRFADPKLGELPYQMRTTVTGPDSYTVEMSVIFPGSTEGRKVMEAKYTRVKP